MAGAPMFWLSNRDDSGGVEQGARGEPASMLQQPTPQWPTQPLTPPNQPISSQTRNPNVMDTPSTTNDVVDGIGGRAGGGGNIQMSPSVIGPSIGDMLRTPPANPLTIETAARLGGSSPSVPSGHTSARGGQYAVPMQERNSEGVLILGRDTSAFAFGSMSTSNAIAIDASGFSSVQSSGLGVTYGVGAFTGYSVRFFHDAPDADAIAGIGTEVGASLNIPIPGTPKVSISIGHERLIAFGEEHNFYGRSLFAGIQTGANTGLISGHAQRSVTTVNTGAQNVAAAAFIAWHPLGRVYQAGRLALDFFRPRIDCPE